MARLGLAAESLVPHRARRAALFSAELHHAEVLMALKPPDPSWLPLRKGALVFHYLPACPEQTPAELIQALCDLAARDAGLCRMEYDEEDGRFEILERIEGVSPTSPPVVVATFRLGDPELLPATFLSIDQDSRQTIENAVSALSHRSGTKDPAWRARAVPYVRAMGKPQR